MSKRNTIGRAMMAGLAVAGLLLATGCSAPGDTGGASAAVGAVDADAPLADMVPDEFTDRGYITVVTDAMYPPYGFRTEDGELTGIDVDTASALQELLGIEVRVVAAGFEAFIPGLDSGRYDAGFNGITDTEDRRKIVDFINFARYGNVFVTRTNMDLEISELTSICGEKLGVEKAGDGIVVSDAISAQCEEIGEPPVALSIYDSTAAALTAMSSDRVDIVLMGSAAGYIAKQSDGEFMVNGPMFGDVEGGYSTGGLAISKGSSLAPVLKEALGELRADGTLAEIYEQYGISSELLIDPEINLGRIEPN